MSAIRRLIPLLDRVLVEKVVAPTKSAGGILLPESAVASKVNEGKVIAVGPGRRNPEGNLMPMNVKVGDHVLLPEYGGSALSLDNKDYHVYNEAEIVGILKKD